MPFMKVDHGPRRGVAHDSVSEIRMGLHGIGEDTKKKGIYFGISEEVIKRAGIEAVQSARAEEGRFVCHIDLQEGVGDDAGFLLIVPTRQGVGYVAGMTRKTARSFNMSVSFAKFQHYILGQDYASTEPVEFTVDEKDHSILIQCPPWLVYNPQSYVEPPKLPAPVPTKPVVVEDRKPRQSTKPSDRIVAKAAAHTLAEKAVGDLVNNRRDRRLAVSLATRMLRK